MTSFRNVNVSPDAPVEQWPYEALVSTIERGTIGDWVLLVRAVDTQPWGIVAREIEDYLSYESPYGVGPLLERALARSRARAEVDERAHVAAEVAQLIEFSGLTLTQFATCIGTSHSRLSTYRSGSVMPSAALMVRMRRAAEMAHAEVHAGRAGVDVRLR